MRANLSNSSNVKPLLMNFTPFSPIEEMEDTKIVYNDYNQIVEIDMRTVGTKCLKTHSTANKSGGSYKADKKNEIDDSKQVK